MTADPSAHAPPAGTPAGSPGGTSAGPEAGELEPFLREAPEIARGLADGVERLGGDGTAEALDSLALLTHRLYGSSSLYGLDRIARLAEAMQGAVAGASREPGGDLGRRRELLGEAVTALDRALGAARDGDGDGAVSEALLARLAELGPPASAARPESATEPPGTDPLAERLRAAAAGNPDVLEFFEPEAREHAEGLAAALAELSAGRGSSAAVETAFRLVHTLKGAAYMVECEPVGELAHAMEDLLQPARHGRLDLDDEAVGALEDAHDVLLRMLAALAGETVPIEAADQRVRERLAALRPEAEEAAEETADDAVPHEAPADDASPREAAAEAATPGEPPPPAAIDEPPATVIAATEVPPIPAASGPPPAVEPEPAAAPDTASSSLAAARGQTIRVGLDRIDRLGHLVGEAMISRGRLEHQLEQLAEIERQVATVRERMSRTAETLDRRRLEAGPRAVPAAGERDRRRPDDDAPSLELDGFSELELDRYDELDVLMRQVAEISFDLGETQSLLGGLSRQMAAEVERSAGLLRRLRGSVGSTRMLPLGRLLERFRRRVERASTGASEPGEPELRTPVRLEIAGRQVEVDTVIVERLAEPLLHLVNNALIHGIESPEERRAAGKPEQATIALRASVRGAFVDLEVEDDGRGLDADLLRRRAVALGVAGEAEAQRMSDAEANDLIFRPGFTTAPRLTGDAGRGIGMDVVRAVVGELNGQVATESLPGRGTRFTLRLPATLVVSTALAVRVGAETFALPTLNIRRLLQADPESLESHDGREWLSLDGEPVEVLRLGRLLGLAAEPPAGILPLAVVQAPGRILALAVDELIGVEEVVVQGLGGFLEGLEGFSGVTISPDGRVVLVLDPATVADLVTASVRPPGTSVAGRQRAGSPEALRPRILLADDSISVRKILGRQLTAAGYEVVTAHDGEQALAELREQTFEALITDIEMPRLNGFELLEMVRRRPAARELPTIVITTRSGGKHRELATRLGAAAYFSKPIDREALLGALAEITTPQRPPRAAAGGAPGLEAR